MRLMLAKVRPVGFLIAAATIALSVLWPAAEAMALPAGTIPYFQATGGDVATGGWFNDDTNQVPCTGSGFYQAPNWSGGQYKTGGILSFDTTSPRAGSHGDYAAYSLGLVETDTSASHSYGFYTGNSGSNSLTFSNYYSLTSPAQPAGFAGGGGLFEGNSGHYDWHCIPDYYKDYLQSGATSVPTPATVNLSTVLGSANQYQDTYSTGSVTVTSGSGVCTAFGAPSYSVAAGKNYTLFVDGNVYLNTNITYAAHDVNSIPRFALVVRGNVYIASCVNRLDGIYIAQPKVGSETTTGQLWTCQNSTGSWVLSDYGVNCKNSITFNGSVIGGQVNLTRMGNAPGGFSQGESFNYTPDTPLGGSFTAPSGGSGGQVGQVDSLIALPPVF